MSEKKTKYIFVTGGVLSSLGKGIASASIATYCYTFKTLWKRCIYVKDRSISKCRSWNYEST